MTATLIEPMSSVVRRFYAKHGRSPVIGVDQDGTTFDMVGGLRPFVAERLDVPQDEWSSRFPQPDDYAMWLGRNFWFRDKEDFLDHFQDAERSGFYRSLPIYDGAVQTLRGLHDAGAQLRTVTARAADFNDDARHAFRTHGLPASMHEIVNSGFTKHLVEGIDVMLDDAPSVIAGLLDAGRRVVIFDQDYNQDIPEHPNARRAYGWGPGMNAAIAELLDGIDA